MSNEVRIDTLIDVSKRLTDVMNREVDLLRQMKIGDIAPLQDEKTALAAAYASALGSVSGDPAALKETAPGLRQALDRVTADLRAAADTNVTVVLAAKAVNERVFKAIGDAVAEQKSPLGAYTATGGSTPHSPGNGALSFSLDDHI